MIEGAGDRRHGVMVKRVLVGAAFLLMFVTGIACGPGAAGNPVSGPEPTPWTEGTLRAAVGATLGAAARTPEARTPETRPTAVIPATVPTFAADASLRPPSVPVPTVALQPPAAPSPVSARVEAADFTAYRIESGWTFIQGFATNTGPVPAGDINVLVILLGDGDRVTGSAHAHIVPMLLEPGERGPWLAQVPGAPDVRRVRVQVTSQPLTDALRGATLRELRLADVEVRPSADPFGSPTIGGTVVNVGGVPALNVEVTAAIFDDEGALFQVARAPAQAPEIAPGQGTPFEIKPIGRGLKEILRYELFVAGRPKG